MKKTAIAAAVACYCVMMYAGAWIPEDFYLSNTPVQSPAGPEMKILPSTLRMVLVEGEAEEIYADVVPEPAYDEGFSWQLLENNGVVRIYPRGKTCAILGVSEGEETIAVSCGGEAAEIAVNVRKAPEVQIRSFEYQGQRSDDTLLQQKVYRTVLRVLITIGSILCFGAVICIISRKGRKRK